MFNRRIPCLCYSVFGLVSVCQLGCVAQQSASTKNFTLDTPIEVIAADPGGSAVLNKDIPGLLEDSHYSAFKGMNLKLLASMSHGELSQQMLAQTESDLMVLRKQVAGGQ
jgi:hypothetical protein